MPSIAVGVAFFILFSTEKLNLFNTYTLLIIVGTVKYIPFASRSSLNSMLQRRARSKKRPSFRIFPGSSA